MSKSANNTEPQVSRAPEPSCPPAPTGAPVSIARPSSTSVSIKHHLHHSYIWLGALRVVPYILIALAASSGEAIFDLLEMSGGGEEALIVSVLVLLSIVVVTGIVMLVRFISYKYIWYEYAGDEFSYYSGIISKKRVHIPYLRIQSVNQKASLLQRIAGVCTVNIETAGGADNTSVVLPYIEASAAESLRRELFERKQQVQQHAAGAVIQGGAERVSSQNSNVFDIPANVANDFRGVFGGEAVDTGAVAYEFGLSNKQLILAAITSKSSFAMVALSVVATIGSIVSSLGILFGASEDEIVGTVSSLISLIPSSWIVSAVASVVVMFLSIMLFVWLITVIGTCITYGGFHTRRRGARIETEYGIISHTFNGIDIDRIQSVEITQTFFQRLLKSCTISLARVSSASSSSSEESNANKQKFVVHPFVRLDEVDRILANLLPEWCNLPACDRTLPKRALRRAITRRAVLQGGGVWLAIGTFVVMLLIGFPYEHHLLSASDMSDYLAFYVIADLISRVLYAIAALIFVLDIVGAVLWQRGSGFGFSRAYITITNSGFSSERTITPRRKVQLATLQTNPLQRRKNLATIIAITAAGVGSSQLKLIDAETKQAGEWFAWCHPGGNR